MELNQFLALLRKDFLIELRTKETLAVIFSLSILLSIIASIGVSSAYISSVTTLKIFPMLLWVIFTFSATVSIGRWQEFELHDRAVEGMILAGVSMPLFYLSKFFTSSVLILFGHLVTTILLCVLLNIPIVEYWFELVLISALVVIGYCALSTLLIGISSTSKLKAMLLPIILLPLPFPLYFSALELTAVLISENRFDCNSHWFSLLVFLDLVYLMLGLTLYEHVIRE